MTIDDDRSVYVGALPYDITDDSLRKAFSLYGHVVAVKINNEGRGRHCYGFVTFTNPRSAVDAIKDMNGRTIGGRVVRVNDVNAQGSRPNNREGYRRSLGRSVSDRRRDRDREPSHYEEHRQAYNRDRSRDRGRYRQREINHDQDRDRSSDRIRERSLERTGEDDRKLEQEWDRDHDLDQYHDREVGRSTRHLKSGNDDEDQELKNSNGSQLGDQRSREHSSESRDSGLVEEELNDARRQIAELYKEIPQLEELMDEKELLVSELQAKAQKLEDALAAAKKLSANRKMQLAKLARCYLHMENCEKKFKSSELELQNLVSTIMMEVEDGNDLCFDDGL